MIKGLNPNLPPLEKLRDQFLHAKPFRHICIDNFLEPSLAKGLLAQFPPFNTERAKNEFGHIGGKATEERVRRLGSAYEQADDLVKNPQFLQYLSIMCGIPDLEYDPAYFGGGTHDNQHGQELDVHVDFNRDATSGKYRRLNLLIYLNEEWYDSWGGQIEIHSNPRTPEKNQVTSFTPIFNRCVIFETHETSWHGFPRITLPPDKRNLSRRSFSVYFYSKHAPECGDVPMHATFYVQRWLPKTIQTGTTLTDEQVREIKTLLTKRDLWIEYYQNKEIEFSRERIHLLKTIETLERSGSPKLIGYVTSSAQPQGWFNDGWCGHESVFHLKFERPANQITINAFLPEATIPGNVLRVVLNGELKEVVALSVGVLNTINIPVTIHNAEVVTIKVVAESSFVPAEIGHSNDPRTLCWILSDITTEH